MIAVRDTIVEVGVGLAVVVGVLLDVGVTEGVWVKVAASVAVGRGAGAGTVGAAGIKSVESHAKTSKPSIESVR